MRNSNYHHFSAADGQIWPIADLPGLKPTECEQLARLNIVTTADLLHNSNSISQQTVIARKLQVHLHHVQKWHAMAELARLPSVGTQYCGVLLHAGIPSVKHLALMNPGRLHRQILQLQVKSTRRRELCPDAAMVQSWIHEAKQF